MATFIACRSPVRSGREGPDRHGGCLCAYPAVMGRLSNLFSRRGRTEPSDNSVTPAAPSSKKDTMDYLKQFVASRKGVEAYVEPENKDTPPTIILIATTGEWTRRRVPSAPVAWSTAEALGIPVYNVQFTGYPQRMRDWNTQQRAARRR